MKALLRTAAVAAGDLHLYRSNRFNIVTLTLLTFSLCGHTEARSSESLHDPNQACAPCHRAIYERYRSTPMANASGHAKDGFLQADFVHRASNVHYQITREDGHIWLKYDRRCTPLAPSLHGRLNFGTSSVQASVVVPIFLNRMASGSNLQSTGMRKISSGTWLPIFKQLRKCR